MRSVRNPYPDLTALLDSTRQLSSEEQAELLLEQGYVERALRIYQELLESSPGDVHLTRRRDWAMRLVARERKPETGTMRKPGAEATLRGMPSPARAAPPEDPTVRRLVIREVG